MPTDGDLVTRISASALIEGVTRKLDFTATLTGQISCFDQLIPMTTTKSTVVGVGADDAGGTIEDWTCLYLENRSETAAEIIHVAISSSTDGKGIWMTIPASRAIVLWSKDFDCDDDAVAGATPSLSQATIVEARSASGNPILRVLAFDDTAASA